MFIDVGFGMDGIVCKLLGIVLILIGGGVCVVYQVGVLFVVVKFFSNLCYNLFFIFCGILVGVINVVGIVCLVDNFGKVVLILVGVWCNMYVYYIYCVDVWGIGIFGICWMFLLVFGWLICNLFCLLFDSLLLCELLIWYFDFKGIECLIFCGVLYVVSILVFGYEFGESISFFQVYFLVQFWWRVQCFGIWVRIGVDYLFVLSVIFFIFLVICIYWEFFGDGLMC